MQMTIRDDESFSNDLNASRNAAILARLTSSQAIDLDPLLGSCDPLASFGQGRTVFPAMSGTMPHLEPAANQKPAIGYRVFTGGKPLCSEKIMEAAAKLSALAIEKECEIVILSDCDNSGFESFGFRVERVAGSNASQKELCIEQIRRFWSIEVLL